MQIPRSQVWAVLGLTGLVSIVTGALFPFAFDDAYISYRITENLFSTGKPYFNLNEAVYTSTSLLYPLWNIIWRSIIGAEWTHHMGAVNGIIQAFTVVWIGYLLFRQSEDSSSWHAGILCMLPLAFGVTQLEFGNSGLETSLYQLSLALSILPKPTAKFGLISGWWLGFIRPEGFLAGWANTLNAVLDKDTSKVKDHIVQGVLAVTLWLIIGYLLFDSIVPQSILAKMNHQIDRTSEIIWGIKQLLFQGGGLYTLLIGLALYVKPNLWKEFRTPAIWLLSYIFFFSVLGAWWPWYVPPMIVPFLYMGGRSGMVLTRAFLKPGLWRGMGLLTVLGYSIYVLSGTIRHLSVSSGAFLKRRSASEVIGKILQQKRLGNANVLLEPLGLIGYYSPQIQFIDYPGLASKEMSDFVRNLSWNLPRGLFDKRMDSAIIAHFRPEMFVLYPREDSAFRLISSLPVKYQIIDSIPYFPADHRFRHMVIYKRID